MFKRTWVVMDEASGGDDGKGGGGGDKGAAGDKSELVLQGLGVLAQSVSQMSESHKEIMNFLKTKAEEDAGGDKGGGGGDKGGSSDDIFAGANLEEMDRKQLAAFLMTKLEERTHQYLSDALKPIDEKIGGVASKLEGDLADRQVKAAENGRPDFYEWRNEIAALIRENPNLNVVRAYTIARAENKDKTQQMDKKYEKKAETASGGFQGFTPGGGGGKGDAPGKMKFAEAAEKAYADVTAALGGLDLSQLSVVGGRR